MVCVPSEQAGPSAVQSQGLPQERSSAAPTAFADENALKDLLGLSSAAVPQPANFQAQTPLSSTFPQPSQVPAPQHIPPPFSAAPPQQNMHGQNNSKPSGFPRGNFGQGGQQQHRRPPQQQQQRPYGNRNQDRNLPRPPAEEHTFVTAPLMPSVILNKNRQVSSSATNGSSPRSAPPPKLPSPITAEPQISQRPVSPVLRASSPLRHSQTAYQALAVGEQTNASQQQNGSLATAHHASAEMASLEQMLRAGAASIPPPPVPEEARPSPTTSSHVTQSQGPPTRLHENTSNQAAEPSPTALNRSAPLEPGHALDVLNETLHRGPLYHPPPGARPMERAMFRDSVVYLMQVSLAVPYCLLSQPILLTISADNG